MQKHIPTYLVYGDSGAGKSSFIKHLGGQDEQFHQPETGGLGVAVTQEAGKLYIINDETLGKIQLIDTRGTWDPGQIDNDQILQNLVKTLLTYSIHEINRTEGHLDNMIHQLDGIIYVHNCFIDRYARNTRITQLGLLIGENLNKSTITIMTRYKEMQNTSLKDNFIEWTTKLHNNNNEYIYWDSQTPIQGQKERLKELLSQLKSIPLTNINTANNQMLQIAKDLQQQDLIEVQETRIKTVEIPYKKEKIKCKSNITNITLTMNPPKGLLKQIGGIYYNYQGWIPIQMPFNLTTGQFTNQSIRIDADFPVHALQPKLILSCELDKDIQEIKGQNIELLNAEFINNGEYYDANFKYKWNGGNSTNIGRIDLKIKMTIQYRQVKEKIKEEKVEYIVTVQKPRYSDEKPYLKQAMEQQFNLLYDKVKERLQ